MILSVNDKHRIHNEGERYVLVVYLLVVVLSSLIGDSLILLASLRHGAIKLNKFLVAVMQHIAVGDILRSATCFIPVIVSLIADEWVLGETTASINLFVDSITFNIGNFLICVLTTGKLLILQFPERTKGWEEREAHIVCTICWLGSLCILLLGRWQYYNGLSFNYEIYKITYYDTSDPTATLVYLTIALIIPTAMVFSATIGTLCYLIKAIKAARTVGGRLRWQGMVTVISTAIVYCFSVGPYLGASVALWENLEQAHMNVSRTGSFMMALNVMSNFFIYSLTIPSFRQFVMSKV